jgi:hypothetical protein
MLSPNLTTQGHFPENKIAYGGIFRKTYLVTKAQAILITADAIIQNMKNKTNDILIMGAAMPITIYTSTIC